MQIAVLYNKPETSRYTQANEQEAVNGVLAEVSAVQKALNELGHRTETIGISLSDNSFEYTLQRLRPDLVFNLFEGYSGLPETEPEIPDMLDRIGLRYTGCPPKALKLALNKSVMKLVLGQNGIITPRSRLIKRSGERKIDMSFPCIVKPDNDDASHGLSMTSVVHDVDSLSRQLDRVFQTHGYGEVLVEEYIDGREFNATAMGNDDIFVTEVSEIIFSLPEGMPKIITYSGKWDEQSDEYRGTTPVCPAKLTESERDYIFGIVKKSYIASGCRGYARIDMRMDSKRRVYVLEVNPNPDISPESGAALQAQAAGMDYTAFIKKIVDLAMER
ncbi:MAG: ATP-grasp domain-containing protein [Dehalococcoidales bacterium]|nr:ATP-grasp domain-containing protein [Dehalococcoidales bacterium]